MKVILVAGGRHYDNETHVWATLDRAKRDLAGFAVLTGACPTGVDRLAEGWAKSRQVPYIGVPAKWNVHGEAAGRLRNKELVNSKLVNFAIIFPGGPGTKHVAGLLEVAKIPTWRLDKPPEA